MAPHHHSGHARGQRPGGVRVKLSDRYFTKGKPIYAAFCARRAEDQQLVHDFRDACRDCGASVSFLVRSLIQEWRRQKEEDARRELWEGFDADALLTDALEAQR